MKTLLKNIAVIAFVIIQVQQSSAQSKSLSFNQIVLITAKDTVPAGKIWKIESALPSTPVKLHDGYTINIDGQDVYISSFLAGPKYWGNITSIDFEGRLTISCTGIYGSVKFKYSGYESNLPIINRTVNLSDINSTSWTPLGTMSPTSPGAITEINEMLMTITSAGSSPWGGAEIRMTVYYSDGTSQTSPAYYNNKSTCTNIGTGIVYYLIGSSSSSYLVNSTTPDTYTVPINFPIWLPEGTIIEPSADIGCLSAIEFDVVTP